MALRLDDTFKYPHPYSVATDRALSETEQRARAYAAQNRTKHVDASSLLRRWASTPEGQWQAEQTARYPSFHASLLESLVPEDTDPVVFRLRVLRGIARAGLYLDRKDPWVNQPTDFHPLGHMARVLTTHDDLVFGGEMSGYHRYPHLIPLARRAAAVHDIGETQHPSIMEKFGFDVGDIPADVGKTPLERQQEREIFTAMLDAVYGDEIDEDTREAMTRIVAHDIDDEETGEAHAFVEFAHHLNGARNGMVLAEAGAHMAEWSEGDVAIANILSLAAEQMEQPLHIKFESLLNHCPRLRMTPAVFVIESALAQLRRDIHCRDDDEKWTSWRNTISDQFGPYTPVAA